MRELLERLCALNAVSSWEDEVRALLLAEVEPHADRLRVAFTTLHLCKFKRT